MPKSSTAAALTIAQLQGILSIADDAVVCFDQKLHIVLFNHGAEMIFGWTREEAVGQMIDLLLPPHVRAGHSKLVHEFGRSGDIARRMGDRRSISGMRKNGEEFPAEASISKLEAEATVIYTAILRDITTQVARERELGTFEQLLVTPLRPMEILVGKTVPALCIGFVEANLIAALACFAYGVPFVGSIVLFNVAIAVFVLSAVGIGLVISSVAKTQQQAILSVFLFLSPAAVLSGFTTPIANMPDWAQALTHLNPIRYMVTLSRGIFLQDLSWALAWPQLWPMALIGCVTLGFATWLFSRRLE